MRCGAVLCCARHKSQDLSQQASSSTRLSSIDQSVVNKGSADVLEALGIDVELTAAQVAECIESTGVGFMFAPVVHPAMKVGRWLHAWLVARAAYEGTGECRRRMPWALACLLTCPSIYPSILD